MNSATTSLLSEMATARESREAATRFAPRPSRSNRWSIKRLGLTVASDVNSQLHLHTSTPKTSHFCRGTWAPDTASSWKPGAAQGLDLLWAEPRSLSGVIRSVIGVYAQDFLHLGVRLLVTALGLVDHRERHAHRDQVGVD